MKKNNLFSRYKRITFFQKNIIFIFLCFSLLCLSTIGYSALNQKLYISGDLALRAVKDIRISNLAFVSSSNEAYEVYNSKFTTDSISLFTIFSEKGSSIIYRGTITNYGTENMIIDTINFSTSSTDISHDISNIKEGTVIKGNTSITFDITLTKTTTPVSSSEVNSILLEITFKEPDPPYTDATIAGNDPNLLNDSLTPVVYDESKSSWVVADTTKEWYNYAKQEWANAVILNSGVTKNVGDTVMVPTDSSSTSEVKAMLVWIPRYEYKITGTYGIHLDGTVGTKALPGQIEIKFISRNQTTADTNYRLHQAFTWDDNSDGVIIDSEHISGIWVGKFETTGTSSAPTILPNSISLTNQTIYNEFTTSKIFSTYLSNVSNADSHMMKNSEWGAVAYLSQSIYGKYGNNDYTGTNKEVYKNDSADYVNLVIYTGKSSGKVPASGDTALGTCNYEDLTNRGSGTGSCGGGASTTGNVTGVYDLVGGGLESVMAYLNISASTWGATSSANLSGFTSPPSSKYYDSYEPIDDSHACNNDICYGEALNETAGWYNDVSNFVSYTYPWIVRGGSSDFDNTAGVFAFGGATGTADLLHSFHTVMLMPGL